MKFYHHKNCNSATAPFKGSDVLYFIIPEGYSPDDKPSTSFPNETSSYSPPPALVIAGYVIGELAKTVQEEKTPVTEVNPIPPGERKELADLLVGMYPKIEKLKVSFW